MKSVCIGLLFASAAWAQLQPAKPQPAKPIAVVSPEVLPDHRVVFRLWAPKATEVSIAGDFWLQQDRTGTLAKDDRGVWSLTTEALPADFYSYYFNVDGVKLPDPVNGLIKPGTVATQSAFWVPGDRAALLEARPVPHGEVRMVYYQSEVLGKQRRMHIYFPPGYNAGQTRYPVLYMLHGGGDDDWAWVTIGRLNFVLDNLIAQGKATPMIVVMPSLWALDPPVRADREPENEALFEKSLKQDIIPYVEKNYRALSTPAGRAIGGLGAGRNNMPDLVWPDIGMFSYVGFTSGGADASRVALLDKEYPDGMNDPANIKRVKFFLGNGTNDHSDESGKYLAGELKRRGYQTTFFETDDNHGWPGFRRYFEQYAQQVFR